MKNYLLEACVDSVESALAADRGGADRLELCSNLIIGGTTPGRFLFQEIRKFSTIKIHVLIRPRFGDFCYSDPEFQIIRHEVEMFRDLGADGVVIGILKPDGTLDTERMEILMRKAENLSVTLHRAFDVCENPHDALEQSVKLGVHTILTTGQKNNCLAGAELIQSLVRQSKGRIDILAAGGVSAEVIKELRPRTKASSYHMSGKVTLNSKMTYRKAGVNMGLPSLSEYEIWQTDEQNIRAAKEVLDKIQ